MNNLTSYVSNFSDINTRVSISLFFLDVLTQPLDLDIVRQVKDFVDADELEPALIDFFVSRNETALQITYAKVIADKLLHDWLPTLRVIDKKIVTLQDAKYLDVKMSKSGMIISMTERDISGPEFSAVNGNLDELHYLSNELVRYNAHIIERIRQFTPNIYNQYRERFSEYILLGGDEPIGGGVHSRPTEPSVKLQWNCSPAIAGYIISELIRAGYIEPPKTHGELSYAKLASICNQLFDIRADGKPTTLDYLKKVVNPESNQLPDYKRAKLILPDLDQL